MMSHHLSLIPSLFFQAARLWWGLWFCCLLKKEVGILTNVASSGVSSSFDEYSSRRGY
jgi:hypothetical protein